MVARRVRARTLGQGGQHGTFAHRELVHALSKEIPACCLHPVHAIAQVDEVEVELEDLVLGELALDEPGEAQFDELSAHGAAVALVHEERIARDLHGDGAESLAHPEVPHVAECRPEYAAPVEAIVLVEATILGGEEGLPYIQGDGIQRNVDATHECDASEKVVVPIHDAAAFAGAKRANSRAGGASLEATGAEP